MDIHWNTKKQHSSHKTSCYEVRIYYFWYLHFKKLDIQLFYTFISLHFYSKTDYTHYLSYPFFRLTRIRKDVIILSKKDFSFFFFFLLFFIYLYPLLLSILLLQLYFFSPIISILLFIHYSYP